mmetsp:Transcript_53743/g.61124  ORF Transcript_53743/g.61124 Transcript_53743/m.61124 type:complete len:514 (+) Transcript_53743:116-1657(+)
MNCITMIVDTTAALTYMELILFTLYTYLESVFHSLGLYFKCDNASIEEIVCDDEVDIQTKTERIERCLRTNKYVDLWELRELALSDGGLLRAKYRQKAWPKLVGLKEDDIPELELCRTRSASPSSVSTLDDIPSSEWFPASNGIIMDEEEKKSEIEANFDLIRRDSGRSVIFRYNEIQNNNNISNTSITPPYASERLVQVLENTIRQENTSLHYYQGLHDIAGVVLHNMDYQVDATTQILKQISHSHLRDAMRENFVNINWFLSVFLPPLVEKVDPYVHYSLQVAQVDLATICLPWMITWFTHDIHDPEIAGRLIDAFLSGHPLMPVYFAVALITHPILKKDLVHADCDDPASIFMLIKTMPLKIKTTQKGTTPNQQERYITVSLQEVLEDSISMMNRMPPRSLLDLVDSNKYSRQELLQRISSISLFKAPASWSMTSGGLPRSWKELNDIEGTTYCVRSKLASGVPMLMNTVSDSEIISRKTWGSRKYLQRTKTLKIRKLIRIILGKLRTKT